MRYAFFDYAFGENSITNFEKNLKKIYYFGISCVLIREGQ